MPNLSASASANGSDRPPQLLLVDDDAGVRRAVSINLMAAGWRCEIACSGQEALDRLESLHPDVILLDVMMPGLDGFETCRRIVADPRRAHVPVILMTALNAQEERIEGLAAGAIDFLTKPVSATELTARLAAARRLHRAHDLLAEVLDAQGELLSMLVSHVRVPLSVVRLNAQAIGFAHERGEPLDADAIHEIERAGQRLSRLVDDVLALARLGPTGLAARRGPVHLAALMDRVLSPLENERLPSRLKWRADPCPPALADGLLLERVLDNVVAQALQRAGPKAGVEVTLTRAEDGSPWRARITVTDPGSPPELAEPLLPPPAISGPPTAACPAGSDPPAPLPETMPLGLTFCARAMEAQGGRLLVAPRPCGGVVVTLELSAAPTTGQSS